MTERTARSVGFCYAAASLMLLAASGLSPARVSHAQTAVDQGALDPGTVGQVSCDKSQTVWHGEDGVGYTLCFPANWFPSGNTYANASEIRNYAPDAGEQSVGQNSASIVVIDTLYASRDDVNAYLDQVAAAADNLLPPDQRATTTPDGSRAVRVYRKQPPEVTVSQKPSATPTSAGPQVLSFESNVAGGTHVYSISGNTRETADQSVVNEILAIEAGFRVLTSQP